MKVKFDNQSSEMIFKIQKMEYFFLVIVPIYTRTANNEKSGEYIVD